MRRPAPGRGSSPAPTAFAAPNCSGSEDGSYLTFDVWRSRDDFEAFSPPTAPIMRRSTAAPKAGPAAEHQIGEYEVMD